MAKASETNNQSQPGVGEPYFCKECKRNHTKGKIYKEHLNFAKIESKNDDVIDDDVIDDDIIDDDIEISDLESKDDNTSEEEVALDDELNEIAKLSEPEKLPLDMFIQSFPSK